MMHNKRCEQSVVYDLHSHTSCSDGQLTPSLLVQRAVAQGVAVLAITDHDTTQGLAQAQHTITTQGLLLQLVAGVEISTIWQQRELHVVGLQIDPHNQKLQQLLQQQQLYRRQRAYQIAQRLAQMNIPGVWQALVAQFGQQTILTRHHIAQVLVQQKACSDIKTAFSRYLGTGKHAAIAPSWPSLLEVVSVIQVAGGQAVLAHLDAYGLTSQQQQQLLVDFCSAGGDALEVAHCQQVTGRRQQLAQYANQYQLLASVGSDFHYPGARYELGRSLTLPSGCRPVWHTWSSDSEVA